MPTFIDSHNSNGIHHRELEKLVNIPADKYGVIHKELFFNKKENKLYCLLEAPNEEAVWKHHEAAGFRCDFITEVDPIKTEKAIRDEKFITLGQMNSNISHDLRTPLTIIKNSRDLISMKCKDHPNPEISKQLEIMDRAIFSINSIINDVLNFAKTQLLNLEEQSLLKIIKQVISTSRIPQNINTVLPENDITLEIDGVKLESALYNIVLNAIQSIGNNQGEIVIRIIEKPEDVVQIQIQNSGPPIPDEILARIFEPLFTTKKRGTGLGLSSCKNIIEQHYGTIKVSNNPTTFTIMLPKNITLAASNKQDL